ncbi:MULTISPECIES: hypothetical protein [Planktothricoides]|uniref:Uncharacterized protein n=1 Tax=Planktothricoides raciborskii FACHB-1370 TaxID=2949576 RepID=A0ABR8EB57_9CYAN|nr:MULTISPECIES: hypothetical protein [Planktothricoides]KOR36479.1 hypothetical protein AM228_11945 [Planktothricoides sp. SR001]MBD2543978.1 hypothetical protein [Planktothricoides raciborskii FACHB-1370]MBD2582966.1 hypothetical protein [Planktothricoides raciborskii FACHB-1261]
MNPQDLIAAFLEVWDSNPDNIWQSSGAIQGLDQLNDSLAACQDKSDLELANELGKWCASYPQLTQKVMDKLGERKLKGSDNDSPNTEDTAYKNIYPKIPEILLTRAPKMGKKEEKS